MSRDNEKIKELKNILKTSQDEDIKQAVKDRLEVLEKRETIYKDE